jgi:predicted TIM-barrel fold metal-dependent hydrolase
MIIDFHAHPGYAQDLAGIREEAKRILREADFHGVQWVCFNAIADWSPKPSQKMVRRGNDWVLALMEEHPDRVVGFCYVNPLHGEAALLEIERCVVNGGMAGVKLWIACKANHPSVDPIAARAAELGAPILQHCCYIPAQSEQTSPAEVAELATRQPKMKMVIAHLTACMERGLADIRPHPNISVDFAGGEPEATWVERAVKWLGPGRVVFGTDAPIRSYGSSLGRVYGARLGARQRELVLGGNARRLLGRRFAG